MDKADAPFAGLRRVTAAGRAKCVNRGLLRPLALEDASTAEQQRRPGMNLELAAAGVLSRVTSPSILALAAVTRSSDPPLTPGGAGTLTHAYATAAEVYDRALDRTDGIAESAGRSQSESEATRPAKNDLPRSR